MAAYTSTKNILPEGVAFAEGDTLTLLNGTQWYYTEAGGWQYVAPSVSVTGTLGYSTGAGGAVTQGTSKSTGVTLSKVCGAITMHNAELAAGDEVGFTVTNTTVAATDVVVACIKSGATAASYILTVDAVAAGSFKLSLGNVSAGALSEAVVINFVVIKAVAA